MTSTEVLLVLNSILLGVISLLFLGIGYFLKDLHKDFKQMMERVHKLHNELNSHVSLFENLTKQEIDTIDTSDNSSPAPAHPKAASEKKSFPLKRGDRGALVKQVQEAFIEKYGESILPSGADGIFGKELVKALTSKGYSPTIDKSTFTKITSSNATAENNAPVNNQAPTNTGNVSVKQAIKIATNIWKGCTLKKLPDLITELEKMHSIKDYTTVNALFKTIRTGGVRQTIVNATLSAFDDATAKQMISQQFERIGLKYDGEKWSLSGFEGKQLMTSRATTIHNLEGIELDVPEQTLLGEKVSQYGGKTKFRTSRTSRNRTIL